MDHTDIKEFKVKSLREQISIVPQEVHLFGTSIKENIRYGQLDATDEEVIQAAKDANAHEFIMQIPEGYDALIGEKGVKLSGGQRQRQAIASEIFKDTAILLLDMDSSSLEPDVV